MLGVGPDGDTDTDGDGDSVALTECDGVPPLFVTEGDVVCVSENDGEDASDADADKG